MKKINLLTSRPRMLILVLILGFLVMGVSYSIWSDTLNVMSKLTTGDFKMTFANVQVQSEYNSTAMIMEDGKSAVITFTEKLPLNSLVKGEYLKINYSIKSEGNFSHITEYSYEPNTSPPVQTVTFNPISKFVVFNGENLYMDSVTEEYGIPLDFDVYPSLSRVPESTTFEGSVYLALTDESKIVVNGLLNQSQFEEISIPSSELPTAIRATVPINDLTEGDTGVLILYEGLIPINLDQEDSYNK